MGALGQAEKAAKDGRRDDIEFGGYWTVQPSRWTFESKKIRRWVEKRLRGRVLNACAGKAKLAHGEEIVRNDIDESREADYHIDVTEIGEHFEQGAFETIVYDPPFSHNQASSSYELEEGTEVVAGEDAITKRQFDELLAPGGRVIQFGFTTTCMPMSMGYDRKEVAIFNTLGRMNDYLAVVDEKPGERPESRGWF